MDWHKIKRDTRWGVTYSINGIQIKDITLPALVDIALQDDTIITTMLLVEKKKEIIHGQGRPEDYIIYTPYINVDYHGHTLKFYLYDQDVLVRLHRDT